MFQSRVREVCEIVDIIKLMVGLWASTKWSGTIKSSLEVFYNPSAFRELEVGNEERLSTAGWNMEIDIWFFW